MSINDTFPQRLDKLQGGEELDHRGHLSQQEQTNRQAINQLKYLLMICETPQFAEFEDTQVFNGWFIGKQFPANYRDFLPNGYLKRFTRRRDIYDKTDVSTSKSERAQAYIRLIFKEFVIYYAKNSVELEELITTITNAQHAKTHT